MLARVMVDWFDWPTADAVVEYGPGTGAFTREILRCKRPETSFFAVEINPSFVEALERLHPELTIYQESVANVHHLCQQEGLEEIDGVVCGLPWAAFSDQDQTAFLDALMTVLKPDGQFATFAYLQGLLLPAGQRFRKKLKTYFSEVKMSPVVWRNLPPAFVYRCRR